MHNTWCLCSPKALLVGCSLPLDLPKGLLKGRRFFSSGICSKIQAPDHPALQICAVEPQKPLEWKEQLVQQLLKLQDSLPVEGSPHGDAHGQHLRYWLCLGHLISHSNSLLAARAAELALQKGSLLPATRVLVQNVWARAASLGPAEIVERLAQLLDDIELPEAFATNCLATAAQLVLHPQRVQLSSELEMRLLGRQLQRKWEILENNTDSGFKMFQTTKWHNMNFVHSRFVRESCVIRMYTVQPANEPVHCFVFGWCKSVRRGCCVRRSETNPDKRQYIGLKKIF